MGDKISARRAAEKVGVSGVPGTTDFIENSSEVIEFAKEHGYPIAIKAAYGGGGRGMKVVHSEEEIQGAIDSAQRGSSGLLRKRRIIHGTLFNKTQTYRSSGSGRFTWQHASSRNSRLLSSTTPSKTDRGSTSFWD